MTIKQEISIKNWRFFQFDRIAMKEEQDNKQKREKAAFMFEEPKNS